MNTILRHKMIPIPGVEPGPAGWKPAILAVRPYGIDDDIVFYYKFKRTWSQLSHIIFDRVIFLISASWASVNLMSGLLFSYQNRSHFLKFRNWIPMMQAKVGPTRPPCSGVSARPPYFKKQQKGTFTNSRLSRCCTARGSSTRLSLVVQQLVWYLKSHAV